MGIYGYIDPDYLKTGTVKKKYDVYSYGVLLLELLSAKKRIELDDDVGFLFSVLIQKEITEKEET